MEAATELATTLAVGFVRGKVLNQRALLRMWARNRTRSEPVKSDRLFALSDELVPLLDELNDLDGPMNSAMRQAIMNIEGRAAVAYWEGVGTILADWLEFRGRITRGAEDPFNMMLNYGYGILYSEVWSAVNTAGLDPFAGFLHTDRPGRPSLVLDVIEEFRQQVVDRVLIALLHRMHSVRSGILDEKGLSKNIRRKIAEAVIARLDDQVVTGTDKVVVKNAIVRQCWQVVKVLRREKMKYEPFFVRW